MRTEALFVLVVLCVPAACAEPVAEVAVDDQSWDDISPAARRAHLESMLDQNLERLGETRSSGEWRAASQEAHRALSLLRVEILSEDPQTYADLEARVEALTDSPPGFVTAEAAETAE